MKKLWSIILCVMMTLCVCGCNSTEKINGEAKSALMRVIEGEGVFSVYNDFTKKTTEETLNDGFEWWSEIQGRKIFAAGAYAFVDFDGDGIEEVVVANMDLSYFLFLRYENGKVQGFVEWEHFYDFKTDGSFANWFYKDYNEDWEGKKVDLICTANFEDDKLEITEKAYKCEENEEYFIAGEAVSKEKCDQFFEEWEKLEKAESKNLDYDDDGKIILE